MKLADAIVAFTLLATIGCGGREDEAMATSGASSEPAASDRVEYAPTVSEDPKEIAEVRRLFQEDLDDLFKSALGAVKRGDWIDLEQQSVLEQRKDRVVADLERILNGDGSVSDAGRTRAAQVLLSLGNPEGERFLLEALRSSRASLRLAALVRLRDRDTEVDFGDARWADLARSLIEDPDPDVAEAAVRLCVSRKVPGSEARIVALLKSGRSKHPREVAEDLARIVESPDATRMVLAYLLKARPPRYDQGLGYRLERLIRGPDPIVAESVRTSFRDFLLGYTGEARHDQSLVRDLALVADRGMEPILDEIVSNAKDPVSRLYAKQALARLHPEDAVGRILRFLDPGGPYDMEIEALREFAAEKDADRIIAALLGAGKSEPSRVITLPATRLLLEILGPRGRAAVERSMDRLDAHARMWALWKLKGLDLGTALDELHAAGVIAMAREPMLERMRRDRASLNVSGPLELSDPGTLDAALNSSGIRTWFDAETGELPCAHHRLILEFAAHSAGRFKPECPVQTWHRKDSDDRDGPYTVRFLHQDRLFSFRAENRGDWYDVAAVQRALNFALKTAGQKERYIALESGDQMAIFVFADPARFLPIAAKYGLPLSDDPDAAMRRGKDYEQRVIQQFRDE